MVSDPEYLHVLVGCVCVPSLEKRLSKDFALELGCFSLELQFSCVLDPGPLSEVICKGFFPFCVLSSHFLDGVL